MSDPSVLSGPRLARLLRKAHSSDPWYGVTDAYHSGQIALLKKALAGRP